MYLRADEKGLFSFMLVKTVHRDFSKDLHGEAALQWGEWVEFPTAKDDVKLQACRFKDLKGFHANLQFNCARKPAPNKTCWRYSFSKSFWGIPQTFCINRHSQPSQMWNCSPWGFMAHVIYTYASSMGFWGFVLQMHI